MLALGTTAGSLVCGLVPALLVEGRGRSLWFVRTAAFLPVVTTMAADRGGLADPLPPGR